MSCVPTPTGVMARMPLLVHRVVLVLPFTSLGIYG